MVIRNSGNCKATFVVSKYVVAGKWSCPSFGFEIQVPEKLSLQEKLQAGLSAKFTGARKA